MTPQENAKLWSERLSGAKSRIKSGIQGVTVSPTQKAAAAVDKYKAGCQKAADDGSFVSGCNKVSLQDWKNAAINKGLNNLDTGVREGEARVAAFQAKAAPFFKAASDAAAAVEGTGRSAAMQKMTAVWDAMDDLKQSLRGG